MRSAAHHYFLIGLMGLSLYLAQSCATSSVSSSRVDNNKKNVEVYSSSDKRTNPRGLSSDSKVSSSTRTLENAIKKDPSDLKSMINLANLYVAQGKLDLAESLAQRVLRSDIKNTAAKKILAQVAIRRSKYDLAELIISGIADENDADILNMRGLIALGRGESNNAMQQFNRAIKADPNNVSARMNIGVSHLNYRQLSAAAIQFERVLILSPNNADAMLHLAVIKGARGDNDSAEAIYKKLIDERSAPLAMHNLAVLQMRKGDFDDAIASLREYLKHAGNDAKQSDEAFALIDKIKQLKAKADGSGVDDEVEPTPTKPAEAKPINAGGEKTEKEQPKKPRDSDIEKLENELIE